MLVYFVLVVHEVMLTRIKLETRSVLQSRNVGDDKL